MAEIIYSIFASWMLAVVISAVLLVNQQLQLEETDHELS